MLPKCFFVALEWSCSKNINIQYKPKVVILGKIWWLDCLRHVDLIWMSRHIMDALIQKSRYRQSQRVKTLGWLCEESNDVGNLLNGYSVDESYAQALYLNGLASPKFLYHLL